MPNLNTPLENIPRISPKYYQQLKKLGLHTIHDLLSYFPFRYDDFSEIVSPDESFLGKNITIEGKVVKQKLARIFKRKMTIAEVMIQDENNVLLKAVWFNQPFVLDSMQEGALVRLSGKLETSGKNFSMTNPAWERAQRETTNTGRIVPVYGETKGITSKWIRWQIKTLLPLSKNISDIIPEEIRKELHLFTLCRAIQERHFPSSQNNLEVAQKTFAFQEMFLAQIRTVQVRNNWENKSASSIVFDKNLVKNFTEKLPFKLTNAQRKASFEILKDLEKNIPMNRLLNGDVGSGKTVVAAIASLQVAATGSQVAIMAPTEILARQHFESFCKLFENYNFKISLLTNSYKMICHSGLGMTEEKREDILEKIKSGKINLVIGTHAIIQKDVRFQNLALIIIDEQHRFGVNQRAFLQQDAMKMSDGQKNTIPHLLTMTATPIPRTLAIAYFGSLSLSILDEMPKGRKKIITRVASSKNQKDIYAFIKDQIKKDRQVFVVFPLIDESQALADVKAVKKEFEKLSQEVFPEFRLGLLHGKLKSKEKEEVMKKFKEREIDILASTSVIEVGVDIPNASIMLIENAERFGLSQLHQFRGRIGRGEHQSYCFLFSENDDVARLRVMEETGDGFVIAQKDLELRGPGQFFGTLQSGLPDIAMENLTNLKLIKLARAKAQEILKQDPKLKSYPIIRTALQKFERQVHLE